MSYILCPCCGHGFFHSDLTQAADVSLSEVIARMVCKHFDVSLDDLKKRHTRGKKSFKDKLYLAKTATCYLMYTHLKMSHKSVSEYFGLFGENQHCYSVNCVQRVRDCLWAKDWMYLDVEELDRQVTQMLNPRLKVA
jgi:chromosomal replication initiation ATPase DnaA